jgi:hypothetical protein
MEARRGSRCTYSSALSLILALVNATLQLLYPWEKTRYLLYRRFTPDFFRLFIFGFYSVFLIIFFKWQLA